MCGRAAVGSKTAHAEAGDTFWWVFAFGSFVSVRWSPVLQMTLQRYIDVRDWEGFIQNFSRCLGGWFFDLMQISQHEVARAHMRAFRNLFHASLPRNRSADVKAA